MVIIAVSNYKRQPLDNKSGIGKVVVVVCWLGLFISFLDCLFIYLITHFNKKNKIQILSLSLSLIYSLLFILFISTHESYKKRKSNNQKRKTNDERRRTK